MIRNVLTFSIALVACAMMASSAQAQCSSCDSCDSGCGGGIGSRLGGGGGGGYAYDHDGMTSPRTERVGLMQSVGGAFRDKFSPHRVYAHGNAGLNAAHTHDWNNSQQNVYSWHGGYQNWRWGTPTALVVPPTAAYQSSYAWGVGQTRSTPIHHQFGRGGAATIGGGNGQGFGWTPYWPHSTDNFGIYPVRSPW